MRPRMKKSWAIAPARALVARACVAEDAALPLEAAVAGPNAVAQGALLADLGEQPAAHSATEDLDRQASGVVLRIGLCDRRIRDADVRLLALLFFVMVIAGRRQHLDGRLGLAVPVA